MKLYMLHFYATQDGSYGYRFFTSAKAAEREAAQWRRDNAGDEPRCDIASIDIEPTKNGILRALNRYASHADNG